MCLLASLSRAVQGPVQLPPIFIAPPLFADPAGVKKGFAVKGAIRHTHDTRHARERAHTNYLGGADKPGDDLTDPDLGVLPMVAYAIVPAYNVPALSGQVCAGVSPFWSQL